MRNVRIVVGVTEWTYAPDQRTLNDPDRLEACGACCDAAVLVRHGIAAVAVNELNYVRANSGEAAVNQGQLPGRLEDYLDANGIAWRAADGFDHDRRAEAFGGGGEMIYLVNANGNLDPAPNGEYGHYIASASVASYYNPWGGRLLQYPDTLMDTPGVTVTGIEVYGVYVEAQQVSYEQVADICRNDVMVAYLSLTDAPPDQQFAEQWTKALADAVWARQDVYGIWTSFYKSPQVMAVLAARKKADYAQPPASS